MNSFDLFCKVKIHHYLLINKKEYNATCIHLIRTVEYKYIHINLFDLHLSIQCIIQPSVFHQINTVYQYLYSTDKHLVEAKICTRNKR